MLTFFKIVEFIQLQRISLLLKKIEVYFPWQYFIYSTNFIFFIFFILGLFIRRIGVNFFFFFPIRSKLFIVWHAWDNFFCCFSVDFF